MSNDNDTPTKSPSTSTATTSTAAQKHNPLHGLTLEYIVTELVAGFGWQNLGERIDIRCFTQDPSVASSLKFLRKTPWARTKVESLYLFMRREQARQKKWSTAATEAQQPTTTPKAPKDDLPTIDINAPARTMAMGTAEADNGDDASDDDDDDSR